MSRKREYVCVVVAVLTAILLNISSAWAQSVGGAATSFAVLGGSSVTANGAGSFVNGNVGVSPGSAINGFPAQATIVPPYSRHSNTGLAIEAQADTLALYNFLATLLPAAPILDQLDGQVLIPGTYSIGAADLAALGTLTFNGAGTYVIKVSSSLSAHVGSQVLLAGGANACSIYWQVTTAATLDGLNFVGNVVAQAAITLGTGDILAGRALTTQLGAVTLSGTNTVGGCSVPIPAIPAPPLPVPVPGPTGPTVDLFLVKSHSGNFVVGTNATYSIALFNRGSAPNTGTYTVTDTLPAGLTFVSVSGTGWSCSASGQIVTCTGNTSVTSAPIPGNINLTVRAGPSAVPTVTNTASVSGGGDSDLSNNTTVDVTIVSPALLPVPTLPAWALLTLTMLLAAAGLTMRSRRPAG